MSQVTDQKQKEVLLERARKRFERSLQIVIDQPAFILKKNFTEVIPGARVTAVLFLSRFVDMFGDLIAKEDYSVQHYKNLNKEKDFRIDESVFDRWQNEGSLT